jgi:tRNA threonylcarbamoyladenosine biosynthesis protein TsaB
MACTAAGLMDEPLPLGVAIDARRDQLYTQFFATGAAPLDGALADPQAIPVTGAAAAVDLFTSQFTSQFTGQIGVLGTGAAQLAALFNALPDAPLTPVMLPELGVPDMPDPAVIARMVVGQTAPTRPAPVEPLYLRPPDAALPATNQQVARK